MKAHHVDNGDDAAVVLDAGSGDEIVAEEAEVSEAVLRSKLKQLRGQLAVCEQDRGENLAGWQRSKADFINFRRTVDEDRIRDKARAQGAVLLAVLPVLDSFASAQADSTWTSVEKEWREGMERIAGQLKSALEGLGLEEFGADGDVFDPVFHECISVSDTTEPSQDNTIAHVLQRGYRVKGEVIRPAKVVVHQVRHA